MACSSENHNSLTFLKNKVDQPLKKSVKFLPETYKNTVLIQIESFKDIDKELPKFIEEFENKIDQGEQIKIPRVVIGVLGTRSKTKSMITKFLQKVENLDILENRFIWYKNLKQLQTKLCIYMYIYIYVYMYTYRI